MILTVNISFVNLFIVFYIFANLVAAKLAVCEMIATMFVGFRDRERARAKNAEYPYGSVSVVIGYIILAISGLTLVVYAIAAGRLDIGGILLLVASAKVEYETAERAIKMIDNGKDCGSYWLGALALGIRMCLVFDIVYIASAIAKL